jgi:hypothetical protein
MSADDDGCPCVGGNLSMKHCTCEIVQLRAKHCDSAEEYMAEMRAERS